MGFRLRKYVALRMWLQVQAKSKIYDYFVNLVARFVCFQIILYVIIY